MMPESRAMVLDILDERGTPLAYANAAARMSFDYSAMLKALGTTLEYEVSQGNGADYEDPQWYAAISFAILVSDYHKAGIHPTDFHPYVSASDVAEVKAAGHVVQVVGEVVMTSRDTFDDVVSLTPEYALAALATSVPSAKLKALMDWGFPEAEMSKRFSYGQLFLDDLLAYRTMGHSAELIVECLQVFPRQLIGVALNLGATVEVVRAFRETADRPKVERTFDVKRALNPGMPDDYIIAMYEN